MIVIKTAIVFTLFGLKTV